MPANRLFKKPIPTLFILHILYILPILHILYIL